MKSGFIALLGRPNAGKSTLLNHIVGQKISIVSSKPQTTRRRIMGVLHQPDTQLVFVDTPGIHKPVTALGEQLNRTARSALGDLTDVDVACLVVNARAAVGSGDARVWEGLPAGSAIILTQCDRAKPHIIAAQLKALAEFEADAYFVVSGVTGEGVEDLISYLTSRMPEGPAYFPSDQLTDLPPAWQIAEVVREELLNHARQELPYSIATRVTHWKDKHIRCEILVERESQKPMVIGHKGETLKRVGIAARAQLGLDDAYLELFVRVEPDWQRRPEIIERVLQVSDPDSG